jgi:hypothetical protein
VGPAGVEAVTLHPYIGRRGTLREGSRFPCGWRRPAGTGTVVDVANHEVTLRLDVPAFNYEPSAEALRRPDLEGREVVTHYTDRLVLFDLEPLGAPPGYATPTT